jgi:hypothetical protein
VSVQEPPSRSDELSVAFECPVCAVAVEAAATCCSVDCTVAAEREVERNVMLLKGPSGRQMEPESRLKLTERNGRLAAALLSWRPEPHDG